MIRSTIRDEAGWRAAQRRCPPPQQPPAALLVLAKAPVAGRAKTRLCPPATPRDAARIAAAALLDTLDAVCAVPSVIPLVAWAGQLADAERRTELEHALRRVIRFDQHGGSLGERIVAAHARVGELLPGAPLLQIGMDTPQLGPADLAGALALLIAPGGPDAVLGPAVDGGWWALGLRDPRAAAAIGSVPTSRADTGAATLRALRGAGLTVAVLPQLRDVDTAEDALLVAAAGAGRRFTAEVAARLGGPVGAHR
jgi:glycosyltransferase A (GT-A) superfamily protein (DUF2064 family)